MVVKRGKIYSKYHGSFILDTNDKNTQLTLSRVKGGIYSFFSKTKESCCFIQSSTP